MSYPKLLFAIVCASGKPTPANPYGFSHYFGRRGGWFKHLDEDFSPAINMGFDGVMAHRLYGEDHTTKRDMDLDMRVQLIDTGWGWLPKEISVALDVFHARHPHAVFVGYLGTRNSRLVDRLLTGRETELIDRLNRSDRELVTREWCDIVIDAASGSRFPDGSPLAIWVQLRQAQKAAQGRHVFTEALADDLTDYDMPDINTWSSDSATVVAEQSWQKGLQHLSGSGWLKRVRYDAHDAAPIIRLQTGHSYGMVSKRGGIEWLIDSCRQFGHTLACTLGEPWANGWTPEQVRDRLLVPWGDFNSDDTSALFLT